MQVYNPNDPQFQKEDKVFDANLSGINFEMGNGFEAGESSTYNMNYSLPKSVYDREEKSLFQNIKRKRKSPFGVGHYIKCVICIAFFFVYFFGGTMSDVYLKKGIPITATVTHVEIGYRGSYSVYGTCKFSQEVPENVEIINVSRNIPIGTVVKGYYLPENPTRVWCKPNTSDEWLANVLVGFIGLVGVIGLIRAFKYQRY